MAQGGTGFLLGDRGELLVVLPQCGAQHRGPSSANAKRSECKKRRMEKEANVNRDRVSSVSGGPNKA
eukprot:3238996-Prymnesium_polylepis.1